MKIEVKKLQKVGNSLAYVVPTKWLQSNGIEEDGKVKIMVGIDDEKIILSRINKETLGSLPTELNLTIERLEKESDERLKKILGTMIRNFVQVMEDRNWDWDTEGQIIPSDGVYLSGMNDANVIANDLRRVGIVPEKRWNITYGEMKDRYKEVLERLKEPEQEERVEIIDTTEEVA